MPIFTDFHCPCLNARIWEANFNGLPMHRFEYGEMNITKLNHRIDDIEDEIYREKLKIQKCADEMGDTFDDMLAHY